MNDIPMSCSKEDKLDRILCILESHRESTLNGPPDALRNTATKIGNDAKVNFGKSKQNYGDDHNCSTNPACNPAWDKFGCIEVYKLKTAEERIDFLKKIKHCWRCGSFFAFKNNKPNHMCKWRPAEKLQVICQGQTSFGPCKLAAAVCLSHPNNASAELHRWLAKSKLKYTVGVVNANISSSDVRTSFKEEMMQFLDVFDGPPDAENFAKAFNSSKNLQRKCSIVQSCKVEKNL